MTPAICYDIRFPYLFWNAAEKTDVYLVIANWSKERRVHWQTLLRARAIENQAYVIGTNFVGKTPMMDHCGNSCVYDPFGNEVLLAGEKEGIYFAEIRKSKINSWRKKFRVFNDRQD